MRALREMRTTSMMATLMTVTRKFTFDGLQNMLLSVEVDYLQWSVVQ